MGLYWNILNNFLNGSTSNSQQNLCYNFWNKLQFETSMNFKGVQTLQEKSGKFTKILTQHDLHKTEFSWAHLYAKIRVLP
jgi:hypothetical protein